MNPLIITGSLGRVSLPLLRWCPDPVVLVEPQEEALYREAHPDIDLVVLNDSGRGFAYMMNACVRVAENMGHRYFVFTDDDVTGLRSRRTVEERFAKVTGDEARAVLARLVALADREDLAQLAVSFSGQSWSAKKPYVEPTGAWGMHVTKVSAVQDVGGYDEGLDIFNDWEMSARLLTRGHRVRRTNLVTFEHKMKSQPGGAQSIYDNRERVRVAAHALAARYPGATSVKYVPAHGLHEVRFNWRRLTPPAGRPEGRCLTQRWC